MAGCDKHKKEKVINAFDEKIEQQFAIWYILRTMLTVLNYKQHKRCFFPDIFKNVIQSI